jgi:hypothetical protein
MSEQELRELLHHASGFAEKMIARKGELSPMWHAIRANGEQFIEPHPMMEKDMANALIRAQFDLLDVVRYIYMGEAWTLVRQAGLPSSAAELASIKSDGISKHPDRVEVVMIQGEDKDAGQFMALREIIRTGNKVKLGPLEITHWPGDGGSSEGRMVGMLPQRGTKQ